MSISDIEYNTLVARLEALERTVSRLTTAITHFVTINQITQLGLLNQTAISDLDTRIDALELQVESLEGFHTV